MASPQLRRSARISARREAISLGTIFQPPLQEPATPIAQDIPEADSSSSDQFHAEPGSDTSYHRTLWRRAFKISRICFQIAMLARIVLFVGQRLPRGAYHEISLFNDLFNAAITLSVLSHILTYHDLQPLLVAHKSFHLPIHDSVLEYARYQRPSSLLPAGSPWLFSPVPRRYLINSTEHDYTGTPFDMVPWFNFYKDLVKVLETMSDDLVWFAETASTSDRFTAEAANSEGWAAETEITDKRTDSQFSEASTDGSLKMDEAIQWCSVSQSLPCDAKNIRFNSLLYDLNKTIRTAVDYWLPPLEDRFHWGEWVVRAHIVMDATISHLDNRLFIWEELGIWVKTNPGATPNSDKPRIECLKRHNSSGLVDVFKACDKYIPSTVDFASAQIQNSTAQDMIQLTADAGQSMSGGGSEEPETYLLEFKSHLEELKRITGRLIQHMEDVLFYFDTAKMTEQAYEARHENHRSRIECRLARLEKTLPFLREIALTRLEDQIERAVLVLLVAKDVNAQRQQIQETMHNLQSPSSWILPPHPTSSWLGWLHWMMGLTPYTSRRLVFPSPERILADANKAAWWVGKLMDYDKFLAEELSKTFELASLKFEKSYSGLLSERGSVQCKVRIVSRWHAADQGKRLDAYAYDGNNCFLHPCVDEMEITESLVNIRHGWWYHLTRWMF